MNEKQSYQSAIFLATQSIENFEGYFKNIPDIEQAIHSMFNISENQNESISDIFLSSKQKSTMLQSSLDNSFSIKTQKLHIELPTSIPSSPFVSTPKLLDFDSQLSATFSYQKASPTGIRLGSPARKLARNANLRQEVDNATRQIHVSGLQRQIEQLKVQMIQIKSNITKKDQALELLKVQGQTIKKQGVRQSENCNKQQEQMNKQMNVVKKLEEMRNHIHHTICSLGNSHPEYTVFVKGKWIYDQAQSLFSQLLDICDSKIYDASKFACLNMQQQVLEVQADIEPHLYKNQQLRDDFSQKEQLLQELKLQYHNCIMNQYK
ncbi:hypothetical protein SS50377_23309 [Spironucleus salmonicida]|uniref:Uncharacterized protein n=1 Tax=Spironucleus salmonicida TaxID=348837 RepID=V6LSH6_9EUKA|nr:hypothetical protein SS50377_23309 [Spironucleus salmonicida]|eukprot:EST47178.1 Hypothetical protein SS50377_12689 [Spironucleus salmonicida]